MKNDLVFIFTFFFLLILPSSFLFLTYDRSVGMCLECKRKAEGSVLARCSLWLSLDWKMFCKIELVTTEKPYDQQKISAYILFLNVSHALLILFCVCTVSYVRRTKQHQWRCRDVTFHCASHGLCEQWVQVVSEQLSFLSMYCLMISSNSRPNALWI